MQKWAYMQSIYAHFLWLYKSMAYSSSSLSTAIKASVGSWTLPRERIIFLPSPSVSAWGPQISYCFGASELPLCQGFAKGKTLVRRKAPPHQSREKEGCKEDAKKLILRRA